jgi:glutamate-1-semialdehyde 2,1-aminomutase
LNPRIAERVIDLYLFDQCEYAWNQCEYAWNVAPGYVDGEDVEVFSRTALLWAHRVATKSDDREHVTPWMRRHLRMATLQPAEDRSGLKTSVDVLEDLERVRELMAQEMACRTP